MSRTSSIYTRVEPEIKEQAEAILSQLGMPMSNAVNLFLHQVILHGGIPFDVTVPKVPMQHGVPDMTRMTKEQFDAEMQKGYDDILAGRVKPIEEVRKAMEERFERRRAK